jgi:hypothetical protein
MLDGGDDIAHARKLYYPYFHPHGIKEMTESKGLRIAYAVVYLLSSLEVGRMDERLTALRALRKEVIDTAEGPLPKNTARVLMQIMKNIVRAHGNYRLQLELARDFRTTASGKPSLVRKQLQRYHLLEMPEEWNQLAFDDHVHDANTKGRKSSTHLIMDAWIKGIRRLRVIHYHYIEPRFAAELLEAAAILEIDVRIGIEFYALYRNKYVQLIWVPRGFTDASGFLCFLAEPGVVRIMEEGRKAAQYQQRHVMELLHRFNDIHGPEINRLLDINLPVFEEKDFLTYVGIGQKSMLHLSKYIEEQVLSLLHQKAEALRREARTAAADRREEIARWFDTMNSCDLEDLLDSRLGKAHNSDIIYPDEPARGDRVPELLSLTAQEILARLTQLVSGYRITLNLSNVDVYEVLELLYDCQGWITRLELFNLKDWADGKTAHVADISRLEQVINQHNVIKLKRVIHDILENLVRRSHGDTDQMDKLKTILHDIETLNSFYLGKPLKARIGSDSTGRSPKVHGMGLVVRETLPRRAQQEIQRTEKLDLRKIIPIRIAALRSIVFEPRPAASPFHRICKWLADRFESLAWLGYSRKKRWLVQSTETRMDERGNLVTLGGVKKTVDNGLYLKPKRSQQGQKRFRWGYLNSHLKNGLKVLVGFIPAFATFYLTKDWWVLAYLGAFIWFGITGLRNILQSVLGGGGMRRSPLLNWGDLISWTRLTDSLLFTGFSVPLLDYVVKTVILERGLSITTATSPVMLYALMALANGIYLASHNIFRGLPKGAVYGNFFRSVLSIPIAIGLNSAIGSLLTMAGVVAVTPILQTWAAVISKAASDIMAGIIEGTADRYNNIRVRLRAYRTKFNDLLNIYTQLELCYPDIESGHVLEHASKTQENACAEARDLENIIMVHALDLLYFWMFQPRAQGAFREFQATLSEDERNILMSSQSTLLRHREVSQMFIDGMLGDKFPRPLSFYLSRHEEYLEAIKRILVINSGAHG